MESGSVQLGTKEAACKNGVWTHPSEASRVYLVLTQGLILD